MPKADPSPDPNLQPRRPAPDTPILKSLPTPELADRIYVVRVDTRLAANAEPPEKGSAYKGPDAARYSGFMFATRQPTDQIGWADDYYLDERANQDDYNFVINYPYVDPAYPQYVRTYVLLRDDVTEPDADATDPIFDGGEAGDEVPILYLTDHKQLRLEDPVLDALFVGVQRVYERLPSPTIRSYEQNREKQIVSVDTQERVSGDAPVSSATTEVLKVERTGTAKERVTTGTVPEVFPADSHEIEKPDLMPPEFRALIPTVTEGETVEGDATLPSLGTGELRKSEQQTDEFSKRTQITKRAPTPLPQTLHDQEIGHLSQGRFGEGFSSVQDVAKTADAGLQSVDTGRLINDSEVKNLGDGNSVKVTRSVADWPILRERLVDDKTGLVVHITKEVIDPLDSNFDPKPAGYVDIHPYDRWRSIKVTSGVELPLPADKTFWTITQLNLPPTLLAVYGNWTRTGSRSGVANENNKRATVEVAIGFGVSVGVTYALGHRGPAFAKVTRKFLAHPPTQADLVAMGATPTLIQPVAGTATATSKESSGGQSVGFKYGSSSIGGRWAQHTVQLPPMLTGSFSTYDLTTSSGTEGQAASASGYNAFALVAGPDSETKVVVNIPNSTPSSLVSGQMIVVAAPVHELPLGIYVVDIITAKIP